MVTSENNSNITVVNLFNFRVTERQQQKYRVRSGEWRLQKTATAQKAVSLCAASFMVEE